MISTKQHLCRSHLYCFVSFRFGIIVYIIASLLCELIRFTTVAFEINEFGFRVRVHVRFRCCIIICALFIFLLFLFPVCVPANERFYFSCGDKI